jgi:hypothetical protein
MKDLDSKIKNFIRNSISNEITRKNVSTQSNVYVHKKVMTNKADTDGFYSPLALTNSPADVSQTLVLVDKEPELNWGHECEYRMYNGDTGDHIETIQAQFPPASFIINNEDYESVGPLAQLKSLSKGNIEIKPIPGLSKLNVTITGNKYAILFSGMSNNRHLNDLEYLYRVLIDIYNFDPNNITVLNFDGTLNYSGSPKPVGNWPGDNTPYRIKINGQGSKSSLESTLDSYKNKLSCDDLLLIHANNHGGGPTVQGGTQPCTLCCYPSWGSFTDVMFGDKLKAFPQFDTLVVMMEQCHSGGFSNPTITNSTANATVFSAACLPWKGSAGGADFDPYAYNWIKKIGENNQVTVHDAYVYAKGHTVSYDTPNEADKPKDCGKSITLKGGSMPTKLIGIQAACNNKYVCAEDGGNQPLIANRDWIRGWETFKLVDLGSGKVAMQACNGKYVCAEDGGNQPLIANRDWIRGWETFEYIDKGNNKFALKACNGKYVCTEDGGSKSLIANRDAIGSWETFSLILT